MKHDLYENSTTSLLERNEQWPFLLKYYDHLLQALFIPDKQEAQTIKT